MSEMKNIDGEILTVKSEGRFFRFMSVVLGMILIIVILTTFDEHLCTKLGTYGTGDPSVLTGKQIAELIQKVDVQEKRLSSLFDSHNKLVEVARYDIGNIQAAFRGLDKIMAHIHGSNVWEEAKSVVIKAPDSMKSESKGSSDEAGNGKS